MGEYTYKNIIINPASEEARKWIGKEVYFSDNIRMCLCRANKYINGFTGILQEIKENEYRPFKVDDNYYQVIIPKKEEQKPESEYVPFKNVSEFIGTYRKVEAIQLKKENFYLSIRGIWLKYKATDTHLVVTEMWGNGLTIGSDTAVTSWNSVLKYYEFLDGTPCGKLKKA